VSAAEGGAGDLLMQLEEWYSAQCDGEWEHRWGIRLHTLDNPGWLVRISLVGTPLAGRSFPQLDRGSDEGDWIACQIDGTDWVGAGGAGQLRRILAVFLAWADEEAGS